ncbi:DUF1002 domain-containing protein [Thermaerobacter litoralis]
MAGNKRNPRLRWIWLVLVVTLVASFVLMTLAPALAASGAGAASGDDPDTPVSDQGPAPGNAGSAPAAGSSGGGSEPANPGQEPAEAGTGRAVVVLGADLTEAQRQEVLRLLGLDPATWDGEPLILTHQEEVALVGDYVPREQLGSRAISSVRVEPAPPGSGIRVETKHITWVAPEMYAEALATAGVKDAVVYVAAPFDVSGTAALAGIYKAYEVAAGTNLDAERKDLGANEIGVMVRIAQEIGSPEKAGQFLTLLKERMAEHPPTSREEILALIRELEQELGIQLSDALREELATLVEKLRDAGIDWQAVTAQLQQVREQVNRFLGEDTPIIRDFFNRLWDWVLAAVDAIRSWFGQ